jgi:uncharacterized protein (DUF433 family)/DNA-binding transcriptional MerR regulator
MTHMLGRGVYSFSEAARLTGLNQSRLREWFRRRPVFQSDFQPVGRDLAISFYDLIDVFVAGSLRNHGVSMQTLRKVYERLRIDLHADHPFCRKELLTDGKQVFSLEHDAKGEAELVELLSKQGVFTRIIRPFLKTIDYDHFKLLAQRWHIATGVVVDPQICFGAPIVEAAGVPTSILWRAYEANERNEVLVANWHGVKPADVLVAATFESGLAA